jgi:hypothetical protein
VTESQRRSVERDPTTRRPSRGSGPPARVKTPESSHRTLATMTDEIPGPGNVPLDPDDNPDVPDAEDPNASPDSDPDDET